MLDTKMDDPIVDNRNLVDQIDSLNENVRNHEGTIGMLVNELEKLYRLVGFDFDGELQDSYYIQKK